MQEASTLLGDFLSSEGDKEGHRFAIPSCCSQGAALRVPVIMGELLPRAKRKQQSESFIRVLRGMVFVLF